MKRQGLAHSSIQRNLSAIRSFYGFLLKQGQSESILQRSAAARSTRDGCPKFWTPIKRRSCSTLTNGSPQALRDKALLELFYGSGLRLSEVAGLRRSDLDLVQGVVKVVGKGSKEH